MKICFDLNEIEANKFHDLIGWSIYGVRSVYLSKKLEQQLGKLLLENYLKRHEREVLRITD